MSNLLLRWQPPALPPQISVRGSPSPERGGASTLPGVRSPRPGAAKGQSGSLGGVGHRGRYINPEEDREKAEKEGARGLGQTPRPRSKSELAVRTAPRRSRTRRAVLGDGGPLAATGPHDLLPYTPRPSAPGEPSVHVHVQTADPGSTPARSVGGARGHRGRQRRSHGRRPTARKLTSVKSDSVFVQEFF